jgi:putative NADH-flavin reductase
MTPVEPSPTPRPLHLVLVGATGRLGSHVLRVAIARGHHVTVLVRDPARLAPVPPAVRVVIGDVCDPETVREALFGAEVLISCLGTRRGQEPADVLSRGMATLVAAAEASGPVHVLAVASAGLLDAPEGGLRRDRASYPAAFKQGSAAHLAAFQVLEASTLPWTLVCPPELVEGLPEQPIHWQRGLLPPGPLRVSMPALAAWMLDEAQVPTQQGQRVGLNDVPAARLTPPENTSPSQADQG